MKQRIIHAAILLTALLLTSRSVLGATTNYVALSGSDVSNGTSWADAWLTISNAVAQSGDGDFILVSNGTYNITAQIIITNGVTLRGFTSNMTDTIVDGGGAVRCFWLSNANAVVDGFTITNGYATGTGQDEYGGGVYIATTGTVQNCLITGNSAESYGGGVNCYYGGMVLNCIIRGNSSEVSAGGVYLYFGGALRNCLIFGNSAATLGGGVYTYYGDMVQSCTISGNQAGEGGGGMVRIHSGTIKNTVIYFNTALFRADVWNGGSAGTWQYCCTKPLQTGTGNIDGEPQLVDKSAGNYRLLPGSPCIDAGAYEDWMDDATDLDGNVRTNGVVDMGAYEFYKGALTCNFTADTRQGTLPLTNVFTGYASGTNETDLYYAWDFNNDGTPDKEGLGQDVVTNVYTNIGTYSVCLTVTNAIGEIASRTNQSYIRVGPVVAYVSTNGAHTSPYTNWVMAATNIHAAVDVGADGTLVLVTNGTYILFNQVSITNGITIRSVNGKDSAIVNGGYPDTTNRCFYLSHSNAVVDGFTITNGNKTGTGLGDYGGGVHIREDGTVQNCTVTSNSAAGYGGGIFCLNGGIVSNCTIRGNSAGSYGGGVSLYYDDNGGIVQKCLISGNSANSCAGGVYFYYGGTVRNCEINGNKATSLHGGGVYAAYGCTVQSCTISGNEAGSNYGGLGCTHGVVSIKNTIVYFNTAPTSPDFGGNRMSSFSYGCTSDTNGCGANCITNNPLFVNAGSGYGLSFSNANDRLKPRSPCIDVGTNESWMDEAFDLDGTARIVRSIVDMGAYEYEPPPGIVFIFY